MYVWPSVHLEPKIYIYISVCVCLSVCRSVWKVSSISEDRYEMNEQMTLRIQLTFSSLKQLPGLGEGLAHLYHSDRMSRVLACAHKYARIDTPTVNQPISGHFSQRNTEWVCV